MFCMVADNNRVGCCGVVVWSCHGGNHELCDIGVRKEEAWANEYWINPIVYLFETKGWTLQPEQLQKKK